MILNPDVRVHGVKPELVVAMHIADRVCEHYGHTMIVTSVAEGVHSPKSLHYVGLAFDFWVKTLPSDEWDVVGGRIRNELHYRLGAGFDYDILYEPKKPHQSSPHIHVEYQPKAPYALEN